MRIPYLNEFDYDLWTTGNGIHCWVRIKSTGEETEVSREVFRELQREQDRLKNLNKPPQPNAGKSSKLHYEINHPLSLDYTPADNESELNCAWLVDRDTPERQASAAELEQQLLELLTERQRDCYYFCMIEGGSIASFARKHGISIQSAHDTFVKIKQKFKRLVEEP